MTEIVQSARRVLLSRWGKLGCWFAAFTLLALVDAGQTYAAQQFEDFCCSWNTALRRALECNYLLAIYGLGVLWLAQRFGLERGRFGRWLAFHVCMSLVFTCLYDASYALVLHGQMSVKGKPFDFGEVFKKLTVLYTPIHVGTYWMIVLAHHGWHFYRRYREREKRAAELEGQLARARLQALRMQLNPHFLFNTLNTIVALLHEQPDVADRTVTRLSDLLRQSLDRSDEHETPLCRELAFLREYLEIEQTRFGDRLGVEFSVPDETLEAMVPTFILQPIVENAIRHGVEPREAAGRVSIRAQRDGARLRLVVSDNGPGLGQVDGAVPAEGVGLSNTRSRLQHLYGDCQSLELRPAEGGGLEVQVSLPLRLSTEPLPPPPCSPAVVVGCAPLPSAP